MMIRITDHPFQVADAVAEFERQSTGAGAIVTFSGLVRPQSAEGVVQTLHLQAYSPMTENGIRDAVDDAQQRWSLSAVQVIHRIGDMAPGDPIVFVATAASHRRAAFEAADFLMDYLKTEAIFWKKEITASESRWIEPRAEDYRDRTRWNQ
jgi:molybdopterin synthase catalytic subunit